MNLDNNAITQLKKTYLAKKKDILSRLKEFRKVWSSGDEEEIFHELAFCLLTPQSKAKSCWAAISSMREENVLLSGTTDEIRQELHHCVRFHNKKAQYLTDAKELFLSKGTVSIKPFIENFSDVYACRDWLVKNIKGLGYKEASHFLRNIGLGDNVAILDRHILRNLQRFAVIEEVPDSLGRSKYLSIEKDLIAFSKQIHIPPSHLDLLLWYKETGEIFK
jgi:N-glycosylase/DNA lyase